jgi:hypothetical protein
VPHRGTAYWGEWLELHLSLMRSNYFAANTGVFELILLGTGSTKKLLGLYAQALRRLRIQPYYL